MNFFNSPHCTSSIHCKACRGKDDTFRKRVTNSFDGITTTNFECPHGRPWGFEGLGDKVERIVKPVAKLIKSPCLTETGELKPESNCAKRRGLLNKLS